MTSSPCPPLKIENGKLYWWNCCAWVEVGALTTTTEDPSGQQPFPPDSEGSFPEFSACGRADALVTAFQGVTETAWANRASNPQTWVPAIKAELGGRDINEFLMANAIYQGSYLDLLFDYDDLVPDDYWQNLRNRIQIFVGATQDDMSSDMYNSILGQVTGQATDAGRVWLGGLFNAVGRYTWNKIMQMGSTNTAADCSPPQPPSGESEPDANGWYWSAPLPDVDLFIPDTAHKQIVFDWQTVKETFGVQFFLVTQGCNIKSMSLPAGTGLTQATGDTSENLHDNQGVCFVHSNDGFKVGLFGVGVATLLGGGGSAWTSTNPAAPSAIGLTNVHGGYCVQGVFNAPGWAHFTNIRLLHHINSAHGAQ